MQGGGIGAGQGIKTPWPCASWLWLNLPVLDPTGFARPLPAQQHSPFMVHPEHMAHITQAAAVGFRLQGAVVI